MTVQNDSWVPPKATVDSGAADNVLPREAFTDIPTTERDNSRTGKYFLTASRDKVYVYGEKHLVVRAQEGQL